MTINRLNIRPGHEGDLPKLLDLVKQLADYEQGLHLVTNDVGKMRKQILVDQDADFLVAEWDGQTVGMALWYKRYSTWRGTTLYLEDLFVEPAYRGLGIGKALFMAVAAIAAAKQYPQMIWQVLDWNTPAINFYKSLGATVGGDDFVNSWLNQEDLQKLVRQVNDEDKPINIAAQ